MPRFDRTGPRGEGPRTGRAMGYCGAPNSPRRVGSGPGRGFGSGRRGGGGYARPRRLRRHACWSRDPLAAQVPMAEARISDERAYLEDMVRSLETELEEFRSRLANLSE